MKKRIEKNTYSEHNKEDAISKIVHDLNSRQVLNVFTDDQLLSIQDIFNLLSLTRKEVIDSLVKLCGLELVTVTIADPHIFFELGVCKFKKLQELLKHHETAINSSQANTN